MNRRDTLRLEDHHRQPGSLHYVWYGSAVFATTFAITCLRPIERTP